MSFSLAEKERLSNRFAASHLANIVEMRRVCLRLHFSLFAHSSRSLLPPPAAVASLPLAPDRRDSKLDFDNKKQDHPIGWSFFLAEKERFELSRRYNRPTPLAGAPLRPLEYFSIYSIANRRCIGLRLCYYIRFFPFCQGLFYFFNLFLKNLLPLLPFRLKKGISHSKDAFFFRSVLIFPASPRRPRKAEFRKCGFPSSAFQTNTSYMPIRSKPTPFRPSR